MRVRIAETGIGASGPEGEWWNGLVSPDPSTTAPTPRPLLLLDVDGPLNPYHAQPHERPAGHAAHRMTPSWLARTPGAPAPHVEPVEVLLDPGHGARLLALPYFELLAAWAADLTMREGAATDGGA